MSWKGTSTTAVIQDLLGVPVRAVMLAATGQHTGKTTLSLGVFRGLVKRWGKGKVAYMKPLGQRYVDITLPDGTVHKVDRDVEVVRRTFNLDTPWEHMSPVVFPPGYTRQCIDGKVSSDDLLSKIKDGFTSLATKADFTLLEGSGHMGVGSIANLNNAQVAGALGLEVVVIAPGGLGVSFDQLALNKALLEKHGARLRGVILNKVEPSKYDMVKDYYGRQLQALWGTPLLGCVPYQDGISRPSLNGFKNLLSGEFVAGEDHAFRTFDSTRLIVSQGDEDKTIYDKVQGQLVITLSSRNDVIESMLRNQLEVLQTSQGTQDLRQGLVLVGHNPPSKGSVEELRKAGIPTVFVKKGESEETTGMFEVMKAMTAFTQKHDYDDQDRLSETMDLIERNIDFDTLSRAPPFGGQMAIRLGELVRW
uniref:DRTGG domain-containing protein n=3 Tax=Hemiselmis andersenii TaxID=464988 RepID=A0A7S0U9F1_HEMAN|mmetsp:Transcript_4499/g.10613  ORF Transcript_4499/g.10613 Transcript_4499/m.10613 type:complete len:420 (+) Transcript_4499:256-1515(+)